MHTLDELAASDFHYVSDDRSVEREAVMPSISVADRLGIVMGSGLDGLGAGNFILASVIAFYDTLRDQKEDVFEYPDFYTFQATSDPADYRMFDIYPDHKNVETARDPESILRAVNDRAIDVLLVPDRPPSSPHIADVTRRSAERGIEACFLYSPEGRLDGDRFLIEAPRQPVAGWLDTTAKTTGAASSAGRCEAGQDPIAQPFRQIPLDAALSYLPSAERE